MFKVATEIFFRVAIELLVELQLGSFVELQLYSCNSAFIQVAVEVPNQLQSFSEEQFV
jgi:hypothetical protein